jgi:acyl-CoA synthetase (AMP-forming)/AMP-acid ligase II
MIENLSSKFDIIEYRSATIKQQIDYEMISVSVERIDSLIKRNLDRHVRNLLFIRPIFSNSINSNAIVLYGHIFKNWNVLFVEPEEESGIWTKVSIKSSSISSLSFDGFSLFTCNLCDLWEREEGPFLIFGTSGTTSRSKLVPINKRRLLHNQDAAKELYGYSKKIFSVMPLGHVNSICGPLTHCLLTGKKLIHADFNSMIYMDVILEKEQPDVLNCSPFFLESLIKLSLALKNKIKLPKSVVCASAPLNVDTLIAIDSENVQLQPAYGLSEAVNFSLGFGYEDDLQASDLLRDYGFLPTGRSLLGNRVEILDDLGNKVPDGVKGRVCISGNSLFKGYLDQQEESPFIQSSFGIMLDSGDLGFNKLINNTTYTTITGRSKETFNFRGVQQYFQDFELELRPTLGPHFYVTDMHYIDKTVERDLRLCVVILKMEIKDRMLNKEILKTNITSKFGSIPFSLITIKEIPRTKSGKIQRFKGVVIVDKIF